MLFFDIIRNRMISLLTAGLPPQMREFIHKKDCIAKLPTPKNQAWYYYPTVDKLSYELLFANRFHRRTLDFS